MLFKKFTIENYKGITYAEFDFTSKPLSKIICLVGLNESGKTTLLEALSLFNASLNIPDEDAFKNYILKDIHDAIPKSKRANFNGSIKVTAELQFEKQDIIDFSELLREDRLNLIKINKLEITREFKFIDSKHDSKNGAHTKWRYEVKVSNIRGPMRVREYGKLIGAAPNPEWIKLYHFCRIRIPEVVYYPHFLFSMPEKIYFKAQPGEKKQDIFFRKLISQIVHRMDNSLEIEKHIVARALAKEDPNEKISLNALLQKVGKFLTSTVIKSWQSISTEKINMRIEARVDLTSTNEVYMMLYIVDEQEEYKFSERSLGFQWFLMFTLLTQFQSNSRKLFLLDEPGSNLHPRAQIKLLEQFNNLPLLVYATHNAYLVNPNWLESTYIVRNKALTYDEKDYSYNDTQTDIDITSYRKFVHEHPNQEFYYQPILDILDHVPSKLTLESNSVILEGKNDYYLFRFIERYVLRRPLKFNIIPCMSAAKVSSVTAVASSLAINFIILLDADRAGTDSAKELKESFGEFCNNKIYVLSDLFDAKVIYFDDIITMGVRENIQKSIFPSILEYRKDAYFRSIQELLNLEQDFQLDKQSTENALKLISFLEKKLDGKE